MSQNRTAFLAVLKEVWNSEKVEEQIYQDSPLLTSIERIQPNTQIGKKALIAVHTGRNGGYTAVDPATGSSSLNAAGKQGVAQAEYLYTSHWMQVSIETALIEESSSSAKAIAQVSNVEMNGAINDLRKQMTRQMFSNGDALIAKCGTTTESTTVKLDSTGFGFDAIERGWLYPGLFVDIGTSASQASIAGGREITAVSESESEPSITISGAAVSTTGSDFVSIANARSGATSREMNGLQNLINSSGVVGGIDPAEEPEWAASVDTTEQSLTLALIYERQRKVFQKSGVEPDWALTSAKQQEALYKLLQSQVRFSGDTGLATGNVQKLMVGNTAVERQLDCPNRAFYLLSKKDLVAIRSDGPKWASQTYGGGSAPVQYVEGTTRVQGGLNYLMQFGLKRRNSHTALTHLK